MFLQNSTLKSTYGIVKPKEHKKVEVQVYKIAAKVRADIFYVNYLIRTCLE
mgnify:CR=1 FL=1